MAFLYVDALSDDYREVRQRARKRERRASYALDIEDRLIETFIALESGRASWRDTRERLTAMGALGPKRAIDPRVALAADRLREHPAEAHSLGELAAAAGLSASRFLHLFKQATGVPLRRYRVWNRMGSVVRAVARGASLTSAALDAGFSSPSHFSSAFREMFGAAPSALSFPGSMGDSSRQKERPGALSRPDLSGGAC